MIGVWLVERLSLMRGTLLITEDGDEIAVEEIIDALAAITRERDEAKEVLRKILECDYDAIETARGDLRHGIVDCCDNTGKHYPSQFLADALKATRVLVGDERRLSTAPLAQDSKAESK